MTIPDNLPAELAAKVEVEAGGCWQWRGSIAPNAYGKAYYERKVQSAHRLVYRLLVGPIPEGLHLDHLCRVKHCVNPEHLEPVTNRENLLRHFRANTHCRHGHEFTEENTRIRNGQRRCWTCDRAGGRAANERYRLRLAAKRDKGARFAAYAVDAELPVTLTVIEGAA